MSVTNSKPKQENMGTRDVEVSQRPNKKWILVVSSVCFLGSFLACENKENQTKKDLEKTISESKVMIQMDKFDSAKLLLDKAKMELNKSIELPTIFEEIKYLTDEKVTDRILKYMPESEYKLLMENKYHKEFYFIKDCLIEEKMNAKLYGKRKSRPALLIAKVETEAVEANPNDLADGRKLLQSIPHPQCDESNMFVGQDGTVIVKVICNGNGKSMDGRIEIKNGIVTNIK
jgi:hypothetical protein